MKNLSINKWFVLLFLFSLSSCEELLLDKKPLVGTTLDNFYQTEADAVSAIHAAYATLQFEMSPEGHFRWFWGDIMSDDAVKGGSGDNDQPLLAALEQFQGPVNTGYLAAEWAADYEGINRANIVLEKVPAIVMDEKLKKRILGEAYFLRAWFFYNLVTIFGDVPKVDRLLSPSEYKMPRSSAESIWNLIESDLTLAVSNLPLRSQYTQADLGRITKGAAQGLLLKSLVWRKKWADAKKIGEALISSGEYKLEPDFNRIFTKAGENGVESVFEIQYMTESGGNWGNNNNNEGTFTNVFTRARGQFDGFGFNIPTKSLVDAFLATGTEDPRLKATVFRVGEPMGDRGIFTKEATGGYPHDYYSKKYFNNRSEQATFGDPNPNGGTNDRVIRYSDVLLLFAESSFQSGDQTSARNALNQVRARVKLPEVTSSGNTLLEAIYNERRLELAMEGHRFFDLVRTGRATSFLGSLGFKENIHKVFPIPQSQIQASNGAVTQNQGY